MSVPNFFNKLNSTDIALLIGTAACLILIYLFIRKIFKDLTAYKHDTDIHHYDTKHLNDGEINTRPDEIQDIMTKPHKKYNKKKQDYLSATKRDPDIEITGAETDVSDKELEMGLVDPDVHIALDKLKGNNPKTEHEKSIDGTLDPKESNHEEVLTELYENRKNNGVSRALESRHVSKQLFGNAIKVVGEESARRYVAKHKNATNHNDHHTHSKEIGR